MAIVTAIFSAIAAFPKILDAIEQLASFIAKQVQVARDNQALKDIADAAAKAKASKDTSGLDHVFDPDKK